MGVNRGLRIDETMNVMMKMDERQVHHWKSNDIISVTIFNINAIHCAIDENKSFQSVFYVIGNRQAFFFVKVCSSEMGASNARYSHHF